MAMALFSLLNVKDILLKVRTTATFDDNAKALTSVEVKSLSETLHCMMNADQSVNGAGESLLKDGIIFFILKCTSNLFPYLCDECGEKSCSELQVEPAVKCISCGIRACKTCCHATIGVLNFL